MAIAIEKLARQIVGDGSATESQCRKLITWIHAEFDWSLTDYKRRTVDEILTRREGNCAEQALLLKSLLSSLDVETRDIAEINIQPPGKNGGNLPNRWR